MNFKYELNADKLREFSANKAYDLFKDNKGYVSLLSGEVVVRSYDTGMNVAPVKTYLEISVLNGPLANSQIVQKDKLGEAVFNKIIEMAKVSNKKKEEIDNASKKLEDDLINRLTNYKMSESKKEKKKEESKTNFSAKVIYFDKEGKKTEKVFENPKDFWTLVRNTSYEKEQVSPNAFDADIKKFFEDLQQGNFNYLNLNGCNKGKRNKGWWVL